jgi:hypothetical protein
MQTLGLADVEDPFTEVAARELIEIAKAGVSDPERRKSFTIQALQQQQHRPRIEHKHRNVRLQATFTLRTLPPSPRCPTGLDVVNRLRPMPPCGGGIVFAGRSIRHLRLMLLRHRRPA